jgi:transcriptional regulator with XRE-family HTH domain
MDKIILEIRKEREKQGISEAELARRVGATQKRVNNFLAGKTKRLDMELVGMLNHALGIAEPDSPVYGVTAIHRALTPEEEQLLEIVRGIPEASDTLRAMAQLSDRRRKIQLGKILEAVEDEEEKRG